MGKLLIALILGLGFTSPIMFEEDVSEVTSTETSEEVSVEEIESTEPSEVPSEEVSVEPSDTPSEEPSVFEPISFSYASEDYNIMAHLKLSDVENAIVTVTYYDENQQSTIETYNFRYVWEGNIVTLYDLTTNEIVEKLEVDKRTRKFSDYIDESEIPEIDYPCDVVIKINNQNYGDILTDIEGGEVGQIVTVYVSPNILCTLTSISANGTQLVKNEDGNYTFALVEGDNTIEGEFIVDKEQFEFIAQQIGSIKNGDWGAIFSVDNLLNFISWGISLFLSSGFFVTLIKSKKLKNKTTEEVASAMTFAAETSIVETVNRVLEKVLGDTFTKYLEKTDSIDETMKVLTRCFVLSQENTPEARLAIIQELTNLKANTQADLTEQVKNMIQSEIQKNNQELEAKKNAIQALKDANSNIKVDVTSSGDDSYGQI